MSVNLYKIKKWAKMLSGNSIYHVNQCEGRAFSADTVRGYYNDLTEKVTLGNLAENELPVTTLDSGKTVLFPIAIFQYGLGAYDLNLLGNDETMLKRVYLCADWAVDNQQPDGGWATFTDEKPEHPYSAMAQGEGTSLLIRAYLVSKNEKYLRSAEKAIDFMLKPIGEGGTAEYSSYGLKLYEFTDEPTVLNGWIFAAWGLWDYCKLFSDNIDCREKLRSTLKTLSDSLESFDNGYWSMYQPKIRITSPFYHRLHIAQLNVLYELTGDISFRKYADIWKKYNKNPINRARAFIKKSVQKILE